MKVQIKVKTEGNTSWVWHLAFETKWISYLLEKNETLLFRFSVFKILRIEKKPSSFCFLRHSRKLYHSTTNSIDAFCVKLLIKSTRVSYFLTPFQSISIVFFQKNQLCLFVCFIIFILCNLLDEKFFSALLSFFFVSWTFLACRNFRNFKLLKVF